MLRALNTAFDIGNLSPGQYFFAIAGLLGTLFAFISPDGEWLKWQLNVWLPMMALLTSHILLLRWTRFARWRALTQLIISGCCATLLFSPFALQFDLWLEQDSYGDTGWWLLLSDEIRHLLPPVLVAWIAINLPWTLGFRLSRQTQAQSPEPVTELRIPFMDLVPAELRGELLYLKAELHYLTVCTGRGKALILYNLKDAIEELPAGSGLQCHRSYWVACAAIRGLRKDGRQGYMELSDGTLVPVSRRRLASVADAVSSATETVQQTSLT